MPDDTTVITNAAETPAEKPLLEDIRSKSVYDILREQKEARMKADETPAPTDDETKKKEEDERLAKEAEDAKEKVEADEASKKRDEEIAARASEAVIAKQKEEEQAKLDKQKAEEEEQKRQEALKPKFTGKDKDGNVTPKDYEEIAAEAARIAKEQAKEEIKAEQAAEKEKERIDKEAQEQTVAQREEQKKKFEEDLQKELDTDLKTIYAAGDLPKVKDPNNENDEGNREFKNLFETAKRVNAERLAAGKPLIRSMQVIRYGRDETGKPYYSPLKDLPGGDAPVLGAESTLSHDLPDDKYIPARDRHKSMAQLLKETADRAAKKMGVRGN
jgi:hypothetical protein